MVQEEGDRNIFHGKSLDQEEQQRYINIPKLCTDDNGEEVKESNSICKERNGRRSGGGEEGGQSHYTTRKEQKKDRRGVCKQEVARRKMERMARKARIVNGKRGKYPRRLELLRLR